MGLLPVGLLGGVDDVVGAVGPVSVAVTEPGVPDADEAVPPGDDETGEETVDEAGGGEADGEVPDKDVDDGDVDGGVATDVAAGSPEDVANDDGAGAETPPLWQPASSRARTAAATAIPGRAVLTTLCSDSPLPTSAIEEYSGRIGVPELFAENAHPGIRNPSPPGTRRDR